MSILINPYYVIPSTDPDAQAFITAASITDPTQQSAVNQLVIDLKAASIWTKMKRIYPMVGGSATQHRVCLKSLTAGTFAGGWTHSATGSKPNGTTGYFDTGYAADSLTNYNTHMSYYSRTDNDGLYVEMGWHASNINRQALHIKYSGAAYYDNYDVTDGRLTFSMAASSSTGFFVSSRTAQNLQKAYKNANIIGTSTTNVTSFLVNLNYYIGQINGLPIYTNRECAFASIGDGLTDTDVTNLTNAVQTFNTTLSRNV